jgi:hypothetical protein
MSTDDPARTARAFQAFQAAASNRDKDPETFEAARTQYYFLTKGPAWLAQEKKRISSTKLDPVIAEYRDTYTILENEAEIQKGYTDTIAAVRNKQQDLTSAAGRQTSFFDKLIENEEQKKGAWDRLVELTNPSYAPEATQVSQDIPGIVQYFSRFPSSFSIILDVLLGFIVIFIVYLLIRKGRLGSFSSQRPPSSGITIIQGTSTVGPQTVRGNWL